MICIDNPELATGSAATSITALVGIASTGDGLDDLALAARMPAPRTLDALFRVLRALSAVGPHCLCRTAEEHESQQEVQRLQALHVGAGDTRAGGPRPARNPGGARHSARATGKTLRSRLRGRDRHAPNRSRGLSTSQSRHLHTPIARIDHPSEGRASPPSRSRPLRSQAGGLPHHPHTIPTIAGTQSHSRAAQNPPPPKGAARPPPPPSRLRPMS